MNGVPFYKTRMGEKFFCKTMPDLIRQLERLNDILQRLVPKEDDDAEAQE